MPAGKFSAPSPRRIGRSQSHGSLATWVRIVKTFSGSSMICTKRGLVAFEANPHHRRAQLVVLTDKGKRAFEAAMNLQVPWVNNLSDGLSVKDLETVHRVVAALRKKLEGQGSQQQA